MLKAERQRIKLSRRKRRQAERLAALHGHMSEPEQLSLDNGHAPPEESAPEEAVVGQGAAEEQQQPERPPKTATPEWAAWVRSFIGKPRLNAETEQEILRLYEDLTIPLGEIAQAYGIGHASMGRLIKKHGIVPRSKRPGARAEVNRLGRLTRQNKRGSLERVDGEMRWVSSNGTPAEPVPEEEPEEMATTEPAKRPRRGRGRTLPPEVKRKIAELYDETGISPADIRRAYGISEPHLYAILKEHNVTPRRSREVKPEPWQGRYEDGPNGPLWVHADSQPPLTYEIEVDDGVEPPAPVAAAPRGHNTHGPARRLTPEQEADLAMRFQTGQTSIPQLAADFGVSEAVVYRRLKEQGVKLKPGRPRYPNGVAQPPTAIVPAARPAQVVLERAWYVEYTIRGGRMLNAPSIEEALRRAKDELGEGAVVSSINPA